MPHVLQIINSSGCRLKLLLHHLIILDGLSEPFPQSTNVQLERLGVELLSFPVSATNG